jgi:uncharacterized protein
MRRIFFATDIHGSEKCFFKFLNAGKHYGADTLILGGDVAGKIMVPVIRQDDEVYRTEYLNETVTVQGQEQLEELLKNIRYSGYYPLMTTNEEVEQLRSDKAESERVFRRVMGETLRRWVEVAEERLGESGVHVYMMLGNDDEPELGSYLEGSDVVVSAEGKALDLGDDLTLLSYGYSNHTPWDSPRELDEGELLRRIEEIASTLSRPERAVFNLHCPPINTPLDEAPKVGKNFRPVATMAGVETTVAGCQATRQSIEAFQPLLGLHGHIHESRGTCKIGRTTCFNPGSEYGEGVLRGVLVVLDTKKPKVKNYMFTSG